MVWITALTAASTVAKEHTAAEIAAGTRSGSERGENASSLSSGSPPRFLIRRSQPESHWLEPQDVLLPPTDPFRVASPRRFRHACSIPTFCQMTHYPRLAA